MNTQQTMTTDNDSPPLFSLGNCYLTPGISHLLEHYALPLHDYLRRHQRGDWGTVSKEDATQNNWSLTQGLRLLSAYDFTSKHGDEIAIKIWVITEADCSITIVLLPEEY